MAGGVDTKTIHTHLDKFAVTLHKIVAHSLIFSVEVHTVAGNLSPPAAWFVPVPTGSNVVPIVVIIIVYATDIFEPLKPTSVLCATLNVEIIGTKFLKVRYHRSVNIGLISDFLVAFEKFA